MDLCQYHNETYNLSFGKNDITHESCQNGTLSKNNVSMVVIKNANVLVWTIVGMWFFTNVMIIKINLIIINTLGIVFVISILLIAFIFLKILNAACLVSQPNCTTAP